ncbi:MAG: type II secretion system protein [Cyanobacteria bacterium P01_A01_bin.83]
MLLYDVLKKSNKGFTLVEMLAALVIVGIIAALAVPNLLGMLNQTRVKDGLGQVEGAIREAQKLARRKGQACRIRFTTNAAGNSIVQIAPDDGTTSFSGCLLSNRELKDSVSFDLLVGDSLVDIDSTNPIELTFSSKGNPDNQRIMVISHEQTPTTQKCIQIQGLLGGILTGNYNADAETNKCEAQ